MKAITTKYHGPTDTRGARISATDNDGNRVSVSYPYELSGEACHAEAVKALCKKLDWHGALISGSSGKGYVWTWLPKGIETKVDRALYPEVLFV